MISGKNKLKGRLLLVSANRHADPYPVYPLGISCLTSYLSAEYPYLEIRIYDMLTGSYNELASLLREYNPDYTGISLRNIDDVNFYKKESFIEHYKNIVSVTRENSKSVVIIGGAGYSIYPKLLFEILNPDYGIYGEGELNLSELLLCLAEERDPHSIEGLVYNTNGTTVVNRRNNYFRQPLIDFDPGMTSYYWQHSGMLNIQTKRGCPYNCIYCTYPVIEGRKVRTLDPARIFKTLSGLYSRGIDYVFFTDSIFNISNDFNMELADMLINSKMNIRWGGYFNFTNLGRDLLIKLKQSGLSHIEFGTESLSDEVLKKYGKPFSVDDIFSGCELCNELGIDFAHFLILGGYGETNATLDETFANSQKISNTVFFPFLGMRIYPGTKLHEIAIEENIIERNDPLLAPVYYLSKDIDSSTLKERAYKTGKRWIFPDNDLSEIMAKMRKRNKKGPLWEYLKQ
jgi:radical SAM superfamily enzyme YgiQ (UPF0313 family)